jgi:hypothetical protein
VAFTTGTSGGKPREQRPWDFGEAHWFGLRLVIVNERIRAQIFDDRMHLDREPRQERLQVALGRPRRFVRVPVWLAKIPSAAFWMRNPELMGIGSNRELAIVGQAAHAPAMLLVLKVMLWAVRSLTRSRRALILENLALRQQLASAVRSGRRPKLVAVDRAFWIALRQVWADWSSFLAIVKPATVVAWHRRAYRIYWRHLGRKPGRPRTDQEPRPLIARMVKENRWGAPRIHGELLKLGFRVSERTVSRYVRAFRPRRPAGTSWMTFLSNHREVLAAMDFFTVPTVTFRLLYVLFVIQHRRRMIVHVNVTQHPTSAWVRQQLREAFPFDQRPRYLLMDQRRDLLGSGCPGGDGNADPAAAYQCAESLAEMEWPSAGWGPVDGSCSIMSSCSTQTTCGDCFSSSGTITTTTALI